MALAPNDSKDEGLETRKVTKEEAAFILGQGGKTKAKLCAVSGAQIELIESRGDRSLGGQLQIRGTLQQRKCARKYVDFVLAQRSGPVQIEDPSVHDDLTLIAVPADTVSFITGKQGSFLRLIEEEWSTLLFFLQVNPRNPPARVDPSRTERLAIFGSERCRQGAKLKVMAAIETKVPGFFTKSVGNIESAEEGLATDTVVLKEEDYSYACGKSGANRKKLARASNCIVEYVGFVAYFCGTKRERACAKEYLRWLLQQHAGEQVHVDPKGRDDVTVVSIPSSCVGFVTGHKGSSLRAVEEETNMSLVDAPGNKGSFLRLVEDEFGTLLFFPDITRTGKHEQLVIVGTERERRGAELKVMAAIEMKQPGFFTQRDSHLPMEDMREGFGTDRMPIGEDDYSYAIGKGGATRKKIARASGCLIEYIGRLAYLSGEKKERTRAREYLNWLFQQRVGPVEVDYSSREDVMVLPVPKDCVGFVTGHKGMSLRSVEDATGTFCFIEGGRDDPHRDPKPLLIFGSPEARAAAEQRLRQRIDQKLVEGWVHEEYPEGGGSSNGYGGYKSYGGYNSGYSNYGNWSSYSHYSGHGSYRGSWESRGSEKGGGRHREGGKRSGRGGWSYADERSQNGAAANQGPSANGAGEQATVDGQTQREEAVFESRRLEVDVSEDEGGWGDWGGSDDEPAPTSSAAFGPPLPTPGMAWSQAVRRTPPSPVANR